MKHACRICLKLFLIALFLEVGTSFLFAQSADPTRREESGLLEILIDCVKAGRKNLKTWQGVAIVRQSDRVSDPVVGIEANPSISRDDLEPLGEEDDPNPKYRLPGKFVSSMRAIVEFKADFGLDSSWAHWRSEPQVRLRAVDTGVDVLVEADSVDVITAVTLKDFLYFDLKSKVVALNDPSGAGALIAVKPSKFRRFATKSPSASAQARSKLSHVFIPSKLYEANDQMPEVRLASQLKWIATVPPERNFIANDSENPQLIVSRVAYKSGRPNTPDGVVITRFRQIEATVAVVESIQCFSGSESGMPMFSEKWDWEKRADVYIPIRVEKSIFDEKGNTAFHRETTLVSYELNKEIDSSVFTEQGLELHEGDLVQARPSKEVNVQTSEGLRPISELLKNNTLSPNPVVSDLPRIVSINICIIALLLIGVYVARRQWRTRQR